MINRPFIYTGSIISFLFFLVSCSNSKQLSFFQDISDTTKVHYINLSGYVPLRLQSNDQVQITISSSAPEASQFFNLMTTIPTTSVAGSASPPSQSFANLYAVSPQGLITLPLLGDIPVLGLTTEEVKLKVISLLADYLKDVVVSVRLANFKVTVIGEVSRPVVVPVLGEQINVLEALGAAGDMTVYGKRYNVKVVRQNGEKMEVAHINFNSSNAIQSPYFQLRQNDIVYVEPNANKGMLGESWALWVPVITSVITLIVVAISSF